MNIGDEMVPAVMAVVMVKLVLQWSVFVLI